MKYRRVLLPLFCTLVVAGTSWQLAQLYHRFDNTLFNSKNWISSKTKLENTLVGAAAFLTTRNALAGEMLNLGAWHGGHELFTSQVFSAEEVTFSFKLGHLAYLAFMYDQTQTDAKGVVFSAGRALLNKSFTVDTRGEFLKQVELEAPPLAHNTWHKAKIIFTPDNTELYLNEKFFTNLPRQVSPATRFGFRGSLGSVFVDDIVIKSLDGSEWNESFSNASVQFSAFIFVFALLFFSCLLIYFIFRLKSEILKPLAFNLFFLLLFAALANYLDKKLFVVKYFAKPNWIEKSFHRGAIGLFNENGESRDAVLSRLNRSYFQNYDKKNFNILFLGSSQTWGTGANAKADIISTQFEAGIRANTGKKNIFVHNTAVPGDKAFQQSAFLQYFETKPPHLLIFNMSNNDNRGGRNFVESVLKIIDFCKKHRAQLVLVKEANYITALSPARIRNHKALERLGREHGYIVLDLHSFLLEKRQSGFLWWDVVHLTTYGMTLASKFLTDQLSSEVLKSYSLATKAH